MAKTLLAAPIAGIRGTVGGLVYSANGSGTFVKSWHPPSNPQTPNQMEQRSYLSRMPALWSALTPTQRSDWADFAALAAQELTDSLGQAYYVSGWLWFVKCNIRLLRVGRTPIQDIPTIARPAAPTISNFWVTQAAADTDLCSGGTPSATSSDPGFPAANAYDDDLGTYWRSANGVITCLVSYLFASAVVPRRLNVYYPTVDSPTAPLTFGFYYFEGGIWNPVLTVSNFHPSTTGWQSFPFPNEISDTLWALAITAVHGPAGNWVSVFEIQNFAGLTDNTYISYPADEFHTVAYDLILHVAMADSQSRAVQYPGYYEILATQGPGRWHTNFQAELAAAFGTILPGRRWFARLYRQTSEGIRSAPSVAATNTAEP